MIFQELHLKSVTLIKNSSNMDLKNIFNSYALFIIVSLLQLLFDHQNEKKQFT